VKKIVPYLFLPLLSACNVGNTDKSIPANDSAKSANIKYPLPSTIDSLLDLLKILPEDTNKENVLIQVGYRLAFSIPDTSLILNNEALALGKKLSADENESIKIAGQKGIANAYGNLGNYYYLKNDYENALDNNLKELKINDSLGNKKGIGRAFGDIGNVYKDRGDFNKALEFYLKGLKNDEDINNKKGISRDLGNIGIVYKLQADYPKALDYYSKALKMDQELGNKNGVARHLGNIGNVYYLQFNYSKAKEYLFQALQMNEANGDRNGVGINLSNIAGIYFDLGKKEVDKIGKDSLFKRALYDYFKAIKIEMELKNDNFIPIWFGNIGSVYTSMEKYDSSFLYLYRALSLEDSIGLKDQMKECFQSLSELYLKSTIPLPDSIGRKKLNMEQMRLRSLHYYKSYTNLRDTLFSEESKKQLVRKELNYEFEKKEADEKAEQDKKDILAGEELKEKERERNYFIAGFALVILLAGFIFRGYWQKQKANEIISQQKLLVEEKQKEILDSIHYAKRIQQSLLTTEKYIDKNLTRLKRK
jgi:tetratricopeptide (TPR) repeat protein